MRVKNGISLILFTLIMLNCAPAYSQLWKMRRVELSAGLGPTQLFGDIGGYSKGDNILGLKDISIKNSRFNINASGKYRLLSDVSVKLGLTYGGFHSSDSKGSNENRLYESSTMFFEPAITGEYYFVKNEGENSFLLMKGSRSSFPKKFFSMLDVYAFGGVGGIFYTVHPNAVLEPNMSKSGGLALTFPVGAGVSFSYSGLYNFGMELGRRFPLSDHLDGYTSQYSKANDAYYLISFSFTYKMRTLANGIPTFLRRRPGR